MKPASMLLSTRTKPLIAVLDSELLYRTSLLEALQEVGYWVIASESKQDVLDRLDQVTPDVVISDVVSPIVDGLTLLQIIKADERFKHIPVIFCTGYWSLRSRLYREGAFAVISKPYQVETLMVALRLALCPFATS